MSLRFLSVSSGNLWLDHEFTPGTTALIGHAGDGVERVLLLAAGCERPARGVVSLDQTPPIDHPKARAGIGTVFDTEWAPRGLRVEHWLAELQRHHAVATASRPIADSLARLGLAHLRQRWTHDLWPHEVRALLLALALGLEAPRLLALSNPFAITGIERAALATELARHAGHAVVLFSTPHLDDAELAGAQQCVFASGRMVGVLPEAAARTSRVSFRVTCDAPGRLCAALLSTPEVTAVSAPHHANTLEVVGTEPMQLSLRIAELALREGVSIENFVQTPIDLETLQAHARGKRDAEYQTAAAVAPSGASRVATVEATSMTSSGSDAVQVAQPEETGETSNG